RFRAASAVSRECKIVTGVDDHSRFCVIAAVVLRANARVVCLALVEAMRTYGVPQEILTDNGSVFTGRFMRPRPPGEVLFDRSCGDTDTTPTPPPPPPATSGGKNPPTTANRAVRCSPCEAHAQNGGRDHLDSRGGGNARRCPVRAVAAGPSGPAAGTRRPPPARRGAADRDPGRRPGDLGDGPPLPSRTAGLGAGPPAPTRLPAAARPLSAQPQPDLCRRGHRLARLGPVLPPPGRLGRAGDPMRRLHEDHPVGRTAAPDPLRRQLP